MTTSTYSDSWLHRHLPFFYKEGPVNVEDDATLDCARLAFPNFWNFLPSVTAPRPKSDSSDDFMCKVMMSTLAL